MRLFRKRLEVLLRHPDAFLGVAELVESHLEPLDRRRVNPADLLGLLRKRVTLRIEGRFGFLGRAGEFLLSRRRFAGRLLAGSLHVAGALGVARRFTRRRYSPIGRLDLFRLPNVFGVVSLARRRVGRVVHRQLFARRSQPFHGGLVLAERTGFDFLGRRLVRVAAHVERIDNAHPLALFAGLANLGLVASLGLDPTSARLFLFQEARRDGRVELPHLFAEGANWPRVDAFDLFRELVEALLELDRRLARLLQTESDLPTLDDQARKVLPQSGFFLTAELDANLAAVGAHASPAVASHNSAAVGRKCGIRPLRHLSH